MKSRIILHIDMNSYFASVSQQYNPELRDRPVAIMGKGKGTVVIAASKEAKKYKIKTGTTRSEAEILYPDIIFVEPYFAAYVHTTSILLNVFHEFSPLVEPFSIDEAFMDITETYDIQHGVSPIDFAYKIKKRLQQELGDIITCSIGIATNKLMAKFASDMQKPDGLVYLHPADYIKTLDQFPLTDICGIGYHINKRLEQLGITTMPQLRAAPYSHLKTEFGKVTGRFLYNASRGENYSKIDPGKYYSDPKSVSHGETFTENKSGTVLLSDIYKLCEKVSLRLRKKNLFTKSLGVYLRDNNFASSAFSQNLENYTNNTIDIYQAVRKHIPANYSSRFVCIYANNLSRYREKDLFAMSDKGDNLQKAMDKINKKYGHFTILPANITKPAETAENNVEIPFSGFDIDAKIGIDLTTILKKDLNIIKHRVINKFPKLQ